MPYFLNEILDLFSFIILGVLLGSLLEHYHNHITQGTRYSYVRVVSTFAFMFITILIGSNIDGEWGKNIFTEMVPFFAILSATIVFIVFRSRYKNNKKIKR